MSANDHFSTNYREARAKFLDACADAGLGPRSFVNPGRGPNGERLETHVARVGAVDADSVLIACSATHGVEGFCGSAALVGFLAERLHTELPANSAAVLVHAINPHGFAHERRVNEDNVDLNRNFIDHDKSHPTNVAYNEVHRWLVPEDWEGIARAEADRAIKGYIQDRGLKTFQAAVTSGQYEHAGGLFYGGRSPTWSNGVWRQVIATEAAGRRRIAFIDFHTGLGPRGYGEPIYSGSVDSPAYRRARQWYGDDVTSTADGTSTSALVRGNLRDAFEHGADGAEVTPIALEFGTLPVTEVLNALRADNWLYLRGRLDSPLGREIKATVRAAFYGEDKTWKRMVWERSAEMLRKAMTALGGS